jgi:hypothetical protein
MALNGSRGKLTTEQLQFAGFDIPRWRWTGWTPAAALVALPDDVELEERRGIRFVVDLGGDRHELGV